MSYVPATLADAYKLLDQSKADGNERVKALHPVMAWRTALVIGTYWDQFGRRSLLIESGYRTKAEQTWLKQDAIRRGRSSYVADPNRHVTTLRNGRPIKGSRHMKQGRFAYAVDFRQPRQGWGPLHALLPKFGLRLTVTNPYEPWHVEAMNVYDGGRWFPAEGSKKRWAPWPPGQAPGDIRVVRRGDFGRDVWVLQRRAGVPDPDGDWGELTDTAINALLKRMGRKPDSTWGKRDERAYQRWVASQEAEPAPAPAPEPEPEPQVEEDWDPTLAEVITTNGVVRPGDRGDVVLLLQLALIGHYGMTAVKPSGTYDEVTRGAVEWLEERNGQKQNGILRPSAVGRIILGRW